jgi:tetratricopeptide (TPR) repeat protein
LNRFAAALAPALLLAVSSLSASAQTPFGETSFDNLNPLFQSVLANPSNLDNTVQYAGSAANGADPETAISTFDQLLFYNPRLANTRFNLGALYYRLRSYEMARGYFQSALEMTDITPEVRARAEQYIAAIDKKVLPDQISGFGQTGVSYQTNPGAGPGQQGALASRRLFDNRFFAQPDWNWFGAFGANYVHDFEDQNGDTFEASAIGYDSQQFKLHQYDIGLMELRAGPRFGITQDGANGPTLKPYGIATGALLADAPYYGGAGGGITAHVNAGEFAFDPYAEIVQQSYRNSTLYPLATGMSGTLSTIGTLASGPIYKGTDSGLGWQLRAAYAHDNANFTPDSFNRYGGDIWLPWHFSIPGDTRLWTLTPSAGASYWQYKAPDPFVDPFTTPHTLEWRVALGLDVPVWNTVTFGLLAQYRVDTSNVAAFSMRDLAFTVGPTVKF